MLDNSFYYGQQGECFLQLDKHWQDIRHEFESQPNKTFLDPEDFSDSVRGLPEDFDDRSGDYVSGEWRALGIQSGDHEGQSFNDYPMLYSILRKFPYKTNVAIMTVGANTKIGNHTDNEGGWRYQMCLDDGGGDQSGMWVKNLETGKQELMTWKTGEAYVFQPLEALRVVLVIFFEPLFSVLGFLPKVNQKCGPLTWIVVESVVQLHTWLKNGGLTSFPGH